MSYDLMVFEPTAAPKERTDFMKWYETQTEWSEDHGYQDHAVSSESLKNWFVDMIQYFPALNGPQASKDDDPTVTDYCIGRNVIYTAFAWSYAEAALPKMRELAIKHKVGFFDVSTEDGEILFPDDATKPWWKIW